MTRAAGHEPNVYTLSEIIDALDLLKELEEVDQIWSGPMSGSAEKREKGLEALVAEETKGGSPV